MSLVSELNNIADELVECHTNFKDILIKRGVNISNSDRLPNLVEKIKSLKVLTDTPIPSDDIVLYTDATQVGNSSMTDKKAYEYSYNGKSGDLRISVYIKAGSYAVACSVKTTRGGTTNTVATFSAPQSQTFTRHSIDFPVLEGDVISFWFKSNTLPNNAYSKDFSITCNYAVFKEEQNV